MGLRLWSLRRALLSPVLCAARVCGALARLLPEQAKCADPSHTHTHKKGAVWKSEHSQISKGGVVVPCVCGALARLPCSLTCFCRAPASPASPPPPARCAAPASCASRGAWCRNCCPRSPRAPADTPAATTSTPAFMRAYLFESRLSLARSIYARCAPLLAAASS